MVKALGWDCAYKSLAWSYIDIDLEIFAKLRIIVQLIENIIKKHLGAVYLTKLLSGKVTPEIFIDALGGEFGKEILNELNSANHILDNFIKINSIGVTDILGGKKVVDIDEVQRTLCLRKWLLESDVAADKIDPESLVIIEHQPSKIGQKTNNKSTMVGHQLLFYYADFNLILINAREKNKIVVKDGMSYEDYLGGRKGKQVVYSARKKHTKCSLVYLLDVFGLRDSIKHIPAKYLDDVADSFMQIFAYLVKNKLFV